MRGGRRAWRWARAALPAVAAAVTCACGGGGGGDSTVSSTTPSGPTVGAQRVFAVSDTDDANNTIPWTLTSTVLAASPDGSYTESEVGDGGAVAVNVTRYGTVNRVLSLETLTPLLSVGQTWPDQSGRVTCDNGLAFDVSVSGAMLVADEAVTLAGGSFPAHRVHYTYTSSNVATGATTVTDTTVWYDSSNGRLLRSVADFSYRNTTFTAGHLVREVRERVSTNL